MRPDILFPLFSEIKTLDGVGPRLARLYEKLAGPAVIDLCWHLPVSFIDRRYAPTLSTAESERVATLTLTIGAQTPPNRPRGPWRVSCSDDSGQIDLIFFRAQADYLKRLLPQGEKRLVSGKIERYGDTLQMIHPDLVAPLDKATEVKRIEAVYPLSAGVNGKPLSKAISRALSLCPDLPEWVDHDLKKRENWPDWKAALLATHSPQDENALSPLCPARQRLAYDELLANQLALALIRQARRKRKGHRTAGDGHLRVRARRLLPFALTTCQENAVTDIVADLESDRQMLRLLQGDVGSGKTVVALLSMLAVLETGAQAALLAPTEILARQHRDSLRPLTEKLGLQTVLLTGRDKGRNRQTLLGKIADGTAQIIIGTHALFQQDVTYHRLNLAVIDEQHRFGVQQRLALSDKGRDPQRGQAPDMLVMTATPIPRTLTLTAFGDMEVSRLTEKPPGRKAVDTRTLPRTRMNDVLQAVGRALNSGAKVYWVCPLVEESEKSDLATAEDRYAQLKDLFGEKVGLVHGKMKSQDKDAVMESFSGPAGITLLVATTVIEVGVNVPDATVMVIEGAERFGLAQLHQLRGRIGRGRDQSTCLLLYNEPLGKIARERLSIMRQSDDGFVIADKDLTLRGAGELLGTRQSGLPDFRLANLDLHGDLLHHAREEVGRILHHDPSLHRERGQALRILLYLFERNTTMSYLKSG